MVSYKQANEHYAREMNLFKMMLETDPNAIKMLESAFLESERDNAPWEVTARNIRAGFAAASNAHMAIVGYAEAVINFEGSKSRFGIQKRAAAAHAKVNPAIQKCAKDIETWTSRAKIYDVTLPIKREGVLIALLADAEFRDIFRLNGTPGNPKSKLEARLVEVCERFAVTADDFSQWRSTQGF